MANHDDAPRRHDLVPHREAAAAVRKSPRTLEGWMYTRQLLDYLTVGSGSHRRTYVSLSAAQALADRLDAPTGPLAERGYTSADIA